jgi:hypothetical protein
LGGKDTLDGGADNDQLFGGDAEDSLVGGAGNDSLDGGASQDNLSGGDGQDTLLGADGDDRLDGGDGADSLSGGQGQDNLTAGAGADTLDGGDGDDQMDGGDDADSLEGGQGQDNMTGGNGADSLSGGTGDDNLTGGAGADLLDGGDNNDWAEGGDGNDTLIGGAGVDQMFGGADRDTFLGPYGTASGDFIDGGEAGDDNDTLDLRGLGRYEIEPDPSDPTNAENGTVYFLDPTTGNRTGSMTFKNIENIIPCFTPGTLIATPRGPVAVQFLREGDSILTRDDGPQVIRWVGRRDLSTADLLIAPHLKPVLILKGSLGNGTPERDMMVSPNHRMLVSDARNDLYFDTHEVLVAAKELTGRKGIRSVAVPGVSYIHFMCDRHQVVLSDGAWTESFQPGEWTLNGMGEAERREIFELFPELRTPAGLANYGAARRSLKQYEARLIA